MSAPGPAAALVWCPFPDPGSARAAIGALLDERLIACANILGPVESHVMWQGAPAINAEIAVLFKTVEDCLPLVLERLGRLHPYDTPAIIGWRCDTAHPATLGWLAATCQPSQRAAE